MSVYRYAFAGLTAIALVAPVVAENIKTPATQIQPTQPAQAVPAPSGAAYVMTKVNINNATVRDLMKVKGINAARARAVVAYRKKHGNFKTIEDLANVKGFKKMKAARLQEVESQIAVE